MKDWIIIDGYNLLGRIFPQALNTDAETLAKNRKRLLLLLEPLVNLLARKITVVYDGAAIEPHLGVQESEIIEVVFTPPNISADSYIENLIWRASNPQKILVVTSDRMEREGVSACGADTMSASLFIKKIESERDSISSRIEKLNRTQKKPSLGDLLPHLVKKQ